MVGNLVAKSVNWHKYIKGNIMSSSDLFRNYLDIINENSQPKIQLDEGMMDTLKSLVPKAMKLLGSDTAAQIAQQVKQATGGDFTPSRENAIKVAKALGFEEILKNKVGQEPQGQLAEAWGLAGNWQGKLIQLLYSIIPAAGIASIAGVGPGGLLGWWLSSVGIVLLMFADTFFSTDTGMVGAMGRKGRKGFDTGDNR